VTPVRVIYLSNAQIPSRSTNALQVMRMCAAFRRCGADVTLVHPRRIGNRPEGYDGDLWSFYGIREPFSILTLPTPLTRRLSAVRFLARPIHATPLALYLLWRCRPGRPSFVCYARSFLGAWLALRVRHLWGVQSACRSVFVEAHDEPRRARDWTVLASADGVIVISDALRRRLVERRPDLEGRVWVEHDGVDLEALANLPIDRGEARKQLALPEEGVIALYAGRVNEEKGADVVLAAAELLRDVGVRFVLVGKIYGDALGARAARLTNVTTTGFVSPHRVPLFLRAADVLLLPGTPRLPYAAYTSPLKMFEYMAAQRPIVASDIPVLREVLNHEENALLYPASSPEALASAVQRLQADPDLSTSLADRANREVQTYSWARRAERILNRLDTSRTS
jgi:glycosyltransferase involved in cell wall biosynthesis